MLIPKYYEMHKPFLEYLKDGQPHTLKELKGQVVNYFHLTDSDLAGLLPSGRQTVFVNRIGWSRTYLKKAGLIDSPVRATFVITTYGQAVLAENLDVIDANYLMKFESFREFQNLSATDDSVEIPHDNETGTPDDTFEDSFRKINESLADELLGEVVKLSFACSFSSTTLFLLVLFHLVRFAL